MSRSAAVLAAAALLVAACKGDDDSDPDLDTLPARTTHAARVDINPRLLRRFRPLPPAPTEDLAVVELGKMLFFEPRLSRHGDVSCNGCHPLERFGCDGEARSIGTDGQRGKRNAPTVLNASLQIAQFWDGRASSLTEQLSGPMFDSTEMAMLGPDDLVATLTSIDGYRRAFAHAFPADSPAVSFDHVATAITAFERTLLTPSRWDRFLDGDTHALTPEELAGAKLFADVGCVSCHTGALVGGSMFQRAGMAIAWPNQTDQGRFDVTHEESDRMVFKVPTLRNVTRTGPYFHDASEATLPGAIRAMAKYQLGEDLSDAEVASIARWLATLESDLPPGARGAPVLPQ